MPTLFSSSCLGIVLAYGLFVGTLTTPLTTTNYARHFVNVTNRMLDNAGAMRILRLPAPQYD